MVQKQNYSHKREAILNVMRGTKSHPTAEWVYQQLKPQYPDLSLGTVYRNISRFKEEGQLITVGVVSGQERFDANVQPHPHFICTACGAVIDIDIHFDDKDFDGLVKEQYGFDVSGHELTFYGTCKSCKARD